MTDINTSGLAREVLVASAPQTNVAGLAREVLLTTPTAAYVTGMVREVLAQFVPPTGGQTSVTINTS